MKNLSQLSQSKIIIRRRFQLLTRIWDEECVPEDLGVAVFKFMVPADVAIAAVDTASVCAKDVVEAGVAC